MTVVQVQPRRIGKKQNPVIDRPFHVEKNNQAAFALGLCYIAVPCLIFLVSFVRPPIGWPLAAVLGWLLYKLIAGKSWTWSPALYLPAAVLSLSLVLIIGIPTGHSAWDWIKHWALINEIADRPWPVRVNLHGEDLYLRYYLAAYLVPALVHKAMPFIPVVVPVTIWFFFGNLLIFQMIGVAHKQRSIVMAATGMFLVVMLTGSDAYMRHVEGALTGKPLQGWMGYHYHSWAGGMGMQFASGVTSLAWVPNQSIPVFIVSAMLLMDQGEGSLARVLVAYGLISLWSPFGMIGLLPLVLFRLKQQWRLLISNRYFVAAVTVGVAFALLAASYLSTEMPQGSICATCALRRSSDLDFIVLFLTSELIAFVFLLGETLFSDEYCRLAFATLIFLPFFHGQSLDFVARGSMGPLFVLALRSTERALDLQFARARLIPAALALALCLPTSVSEIVFHLENGAVYRTVDGRKLPEAHGAGTFSTSSSVTVTEFLNSCGWKYEPQYFSHAKAKILRSPD